MHVHMHIQTLARTNNTETQALTRAIIHVRTPAHDLVLARVHVHR